MPFLPQPYLEQFSKSFNAIPPINRALIRKIIKQELHGYPEELFEEFESLPFGSASLGQVHKALYQHNILAVKVQYPGIANSIESDMGVLNFVLSHIIKTNSMGHIVEEINQRLYEEIDYCNEAKNVTFFREHISHPKVIIPEVYENLSSSKVLTCSFLKGDSFNDFLQSHPIQEELDHYAQTLFDTFFTTLYQLHTIHADPNSGNFIFMENGMLGMIDFGCVKKVDHDFLYAFNRLHLSLLGGVEEREIVRHYLELDMIDKSDEETMLTFYQEIIKPLDRIYIEVLKEDCYDFGVHNNFSKRGFETIMNIQKKQTNAVHKLNQEYVFLDRTLLGYYAMFEQMGAKIDTRFAKNMMAGYTRNV